MHKALIFVMGLAGLVLLICGYLTMTEKPDKGGKCKSSGGRAVSITIIGIGLSLAVISGVIYHQQQPVSPPLQGPAFGGPGSLEE